MVPIYPLSLSSFQTRPPNEVGPELHEITEDYQEHKARKLGAYMFGIVKYRVMYVLSYAKHMRPFPSPTLLSLHPPLSSHFIPSFLSLLPLIPCLRFEAANCQVLHDTLCDAGSGGWLWAANVPAIWWH